MGEPASALTWSFACPDWWARLQTGRSLVPDLPINLDEGQRAVEIFNKLRLPDVPDQPMMRDGAGDWFRDIVRAAFGSLDPATGRRHVAEIFALVPKKNSKTTGAAGIALTAMLMNERPRAEMLFVGPTQDVADTAFSQAVGMIEADPYLAKRFQVQEHIKTIVDRTNKAKLKIKTFDLRVMTGSKPVVVIIDELHVMALLHYASRVVGQIRGGLLASPESLLVIITTQSDAPAAGVFRAELQYARGVRDGRITQNVRMLPILYEFPEKLQIDKSKPWLDPKLWPMVTPNLGLSITVDRLIDDFAQASEKGEEEVRRWASQHLNIEIGLALHSERWRGADFWVESADRALTLEALIDRSEVIVAGIDGGGLDDMLALAAIGRERGTNRWLIWAKAWVQEAVLELRKEIAERLRDFAADGDLVICQTPTQDIDELATTVAKLKASGKLPDPKSCAAVGLDPAGVSAIVDARTAPDGGLEADQLVGIQQGYRLSGAVWGLERKLSDGTARHSGARLLAWCVGNAKAEQRGNAVLITKEAAGKAKIDPLMAIFDAFQLMARNPQAEGRSYIEDGDVIMI
jgi:phage terminase large subunit-like protein